MKYESSHMGGLKRSEQNKKHRRCFPAWLKKLTAVTILIAVPFIAAAALSTLANETLDIARYEIKSEKLANPVRIVMISDLHRRKLDETNQQVVDRTALESPDLIIVNGDMLEPDYTEEEAAAYESLLSRLSAIAPVYFSAGNHDYYAYFSEIEFAKTELLRGIQPSPLVDRLESTGARFLERDFADIEVNGNAVRIGGLYAFAFQYKDYTEEQFESIREFLESFRSTDSFTLLLCHRPVSFTAGDADCENIDLVLSGHTHNGVIALPFGLGAIFASSSFFPEYDRGLFRLDETSLIVGAGIDGYQGFVPRVFNPPEIVTVDILPEEALSVKG